MIQCIEPVQAELQVHPFSHMEVFVNSEIQVLITRSATITSRFDQRICVCSNLQTRERESCRVKHLVAMDADVATLPRDNQRTHVSSISSSIQVVPSTTGRCPGVIDGYGIPVFERPDG